MFENLIDRLEHSFKLLKGEGRITEINIAETPKDVRKALLDADVSYKLAKSFCDSVKEKALGMDVLKSIKPGQMMVKIVHDELAALMGSTSSDINIKGNPGIVLVSGLQGSGKTTFSGKLALNCKSKRGLKVLLVAGDVYRPAAIDQLKVLGLVLLSILRRVIRIRLRLLRMLLRLPRGRAILLLLWILPAVLRLMSR